MSKCILCNKPMSPYRPKRTLATCTKCHRTYNHVYYRYSKSGKDILKIYGNKENIRP